MVENLTSSGFEKGISSGNVVVDYWAEWCGPCKMMAPVIDQLSKDMTNVKFAKVNVDEEPELAGNAGVRGIPTLVLYKDGKEVNRIVGALPASDLKSKIESIFS